MISLQRLADTVEDADLYHEFNASLEVSSTQVHSMPEQRIKITSFISKDTFRKEQFHANGNLAFKK